MFIKLIYLLINHTILSYNYLLLRGDFRIGLDISSMVANTAARGLITGPIRKSSRNDIFIN